MAVGNEQVAKEIYFGPFHLRDWPTVDELAPYFLTPDGIEHWYKSGNDNWGINAYGLYGTGGLPEHKRRGTNVPGTEVDAKILMYGDPEFGALLYYRKWGGGYEENYCSRGDLSRPREWIRTL